jgi:prepilin-type N-terminal cleavage/methylation domain-containing protein/prepilin-type processing-associated H-X9-DG protein
MKTEKNKKGFTLVELLVVISIIAMLLAVLIPSLCAVREQAKRLICLSRIRQLVLACYVYAQNNDNYFPPALLAYKFEDSYFTISHWDFIAIKDWSRNQVIIKPGILWQDQTIEQVQQCPSYKGDDNAFGSKFTGYNYNTTYIGHGFGEPVERPAKVTDVKRPSECALFGDGGFDGGANKFMRAPFLPPQGGDVSWIYAGTQAYRHRKKTNTAFCDGSAVSTGKCFKNTEPGIKEKVAAGTGFLSPDNSAYDLE